MNDQTSRSSTNDSESIDYVKKEMLKSIAGLLQEIIDEQGEKREPKKTIFTAKSIPGITIENYLDRIIKYTKLETSTLILTLINIDKICEINSLQITRFNVHRLLLSSVLISIKFNEDDFYSNSYYARVGGVSLQEINNLEDEFLRMIKFCLWTEINLFNKYKVYLGKYEKE